MQQATANHNNHARLIGIATAFMCALAAGAVWCLISLYVRRDLAAFAFVVALLVVWALRAHGHGGRRSGALIAGLLVAFGTAYALYLQAVAEVAAVLGLSMRATLQTIDLSLAFAIARAHLRGGAGVLAAAAVVLSIVLMLLPLRPPQVRSL